MVPTRTSELWLFSDLQSLESGIHPVSFKVIKRTFFKHFLPELPKRSRRTAWGERQRAGRDGPGVEDPPGVRNGVVSDVTVAQLHATLYGRSRGRFYSVRPCSAIEREPHWKGGCSQRLGCRNLRHDYLARILRIAGGPIPRSIRQVLEFTEY